MEINWKPVVPHIYQRGGLYEIKSVECGYTEIYRWVNMDISTDWICDGITKYYKQKLQVSNDNEQTWHDVIPYQYQRGDVYETQSTDCGYSHDIKFILTYSDGSTFTKYCNEYSYILGREVMEGGQKSEITEIFIGSCVNGISMNAFNGVCKLKRVNSNVDGVMNIPEGVLEIEENAFTWTCSSCHITSITLPSTMQRLSLDAFDSDYCHQTLTINAVTPPYMYLDEYDYFPKPIYVPCQSVSAYKTASGWSQFKDYIYGIPPCAQPKWIATRYPSTTLSAECDASSAITENEIPAKWGVTSVEIGDCVTSLGYRAFQGFSALTSVTLSNSIKSFSGNVFESCDSLTSITVPNSVTEIGTYAFWSCVGLTNVVLSTGITKIGKKTFLGCVNLTGMTIPNNVTAIDGWAFQDCYSLTSVGSVGSGASIEIPNRVTSISEGCFYRCSGLTSVTIPNGITEIGGGAFEYCTSLTSVTIPNSVTSIVGRAFFSCSGLTSITVSATTPPTLGTLGGNAFYDTNNCPIYVPASSLESYKTASGWSQYAGRIFPIT